jgi:hypothetical protein
MAMGKASTMLGDWGVVTRICGRFILVIGVDYLYFELLKNFISIFILFNSFLVEAYITLARLLHFKFF